MASRISPKLTALIVAQIGLEAESRQFWLARRHWAKYKRWIGLHKVCHTYVDEEARHLDKWVKLLMHYGEDFPAMPAVAEQKATPATPLDLVNGALGFMDSVTAKIKEIAAFAATDAPELTDFVQWFLDDQVKGVSDLTAMKADFALAGSDVAAMLAVDKRIGIRA